jgi:predicted Ser/Thr protein kinase
VIAGRYRVVRKLGSGGSGAVFLAEDEQLRRPVALKRLHSSADADVAERFRREAQLGASLGHPNVVGVWDVLDEEGDVVLVMEHIDGESLADAIRRGPLDPEKAVDVLEQVADALDHAHRQGVIHRDVKPANILIRRDGMVKLADLGIATAANLARITRTGDTVGTLGYMAPEQIEGNGSSAASDVYALAVVAFEMLSGRQARTAESPMALMNQVMTEPPPDLRAEWPQAPEEAATVLRRGMASDPGERQRSAGELVDELRAALGREPAAAPLLPEQGEDLERPTREPFGSPTHRARGTARRRLAAVVGLVAIAAIAAGTFALLGGDESPTREAEREAAEGEEAAGDGEAGGAAETASGAAVGGEEAASAAVGEPVQVTRDFYELAAAEDYQGAWALADDSFRAQLGGYEALRSQFETLESVSFERAEVASQAADAATVEIATTAVHADRTDICDGQVTLVPGGVAGWLIDRIGVSCVASR